MKEIIQLVLISLFLSIGILYANDGMAAITTSGIVFKNSENISIEKERLTISKEIIVVEYLFKNNSDRDIETIIAFPLPDIICDPFEGMNYPENFRAFINDTEITVKREIKAIVYTDRDEFKTDQEVTSLLKGYGIPLDCRDIAEVKDDTELKEMSVEYKKLMDLGLACCDPKLDPWEIYYKTKINYYWEQKFPAQKTVKIKHTYKPSLGMRNGYYEEDAMRAPIEDKIETYRSFYLNQSENDLPDNKYTYKDKSYSYLQYILWTANTWKGPIKEFELIIRNTSNLNVTSLEGPFEFENGNLKIIKRNFEPIDDLYVFFFQ